MKTKDQRGSDVFGEAARKAVRKAGWDPRYDLELLKPDGVATSSISRYGYRSGRVRLTHSPELFDQLTRTVETLGHGGEDKCACALSDVVASRVYLQVGSHRVCPSSTYDYAEILEAASDGMRSAGAADSEVRAFVVPITSFFIASVIAGVYSLHGPDTAAFRRGFLLDHINASLVSGRTLSRYVAVYTSIQLRLWSKEASLADSLSACFPVPFDALEFETDRGVAVLLDTFDLADHNDTGLAWSNEEAYWLVMDELKYGWRRWPIKAFQFAEILAPYVISEQQGRELPPQPQAGRGNRGDRPSDAAQQRWAVVNPGGANGVRELLPQEGALRQLPGTPVDPFADRLASSPAFRQQLAQSCIDRGKSPLQYHLTFDALVVLYESRATDVRIASEPIRRSGLAFPLAYMTREKIGTDLSNFSRIDWGATRRKRNGRLQLYRKKLPITDQTPVRVEMGSFPDLLLVVDSSGSMGWDPGRGSGPYDSLLRAIFSVFRFLEKSSKIQHMRFCVVNFSNKTLKTPWLPYYSLNEIKRLLFNRQGGGTKLDCSVLRHVAMSSSDRFLCLMVTDSQIANAEEVISTIQMIRGLGHGFVLLQIGQAVPMTEAVKGAGHTVHVISDHRQLEGMCLEYASNTWGT